jgi:glycosyltransferase involved in cell wall biosynthesis
MTKISVLMSIYHKETSHNLKQCLESLINQTLQADEIIIVKDGALTDELEKTLHEWQDKLPLKIVGYEENKGLAYALNYGLRHCSYELIARMDSDDICLSDRLEKQLLFFEKNKTTVLISGYIKEFNEMPNDILSIREVPLDYEKIVKYLKRRNAFNHMAVMFRKYAVLLLDGYQEIEGFEDYDLWIRLVQAGFKVGNIPEILVYVRIGNNMIKRRSGFRYAGRQLFFWNIQRKRHFISLSEFIVLSIFSVPIRLLPNNIIAIIYYKFFRKRI